MQALFDVVLPVFAIVAAGYACGWKRLLGGESSEALNGFVYWVALPALLFKAMASVDLAEVWNAPFLAAFAGASVATWVIASIVGRKVFRLDAAEAALHGLNGAYPNSGFMGIPLAIAAYGEEAALPAIVAAVISVLSVALAVVPIEIARPGTSRLLPLIGRVMGALARNPMIVAPCAGLAWSSTGLGLFGSIQTFTGILGAAAGPCALFSIGLFLVGKPLREGSAEIAAMTFAKLIVHPLLTAFAILVLFPTDPLWATVAILSAALPIGSGPFVLAQATGIYVRRTSTVMLATTVASVVTISVFSHLPHRPITLGPDNLWIIDRQARRPSVLAAGKEPGAP
ncbi:MAG: AEC family transporter [Geminicoccaceae bacterium]